MERERGREILSVLVHCLTVLQQAEAGSWELGNESWVFQVGGRAPVI